MKEQLTQEDLINAAEETVRDYCERGKKCVVWDKPVIEMTQFELYVVIGFLDEAVELIQKGGLISRKILNRLH